jgi:hypothetical protein
MIEIFIGYNTSNVKIIINFIIIIITIIINCGSGGGDSSSSRSAAASLLRLLVRFLQEIWTFSFCKYCVISSRGLCDELITGPEESFRLWCVVV